MKWQKLKGKAIENNWYQQSWIKILRNNMLPTSKKLNAGSEYCG